MAKHRRPPLDIHRRHRPVQGGAGHPCPDEPRVLEEWDGFDHEPVGQPRISRRLGSG
ncbi:MULTISPECIES: hypothetical protein [unclassified Streptomyces]|uniref:hypothetical protein n=1 Tax=unclassified Streptomyces TaxID=2593676 RepID=UPI002E29C5F6|nr:hypothetical protein [Streptomyces sp. NBC_01439]